MERPVELLDHLRLALEHEHMRPPNRRYVERLVARVQHQDLLQDRQKVAAGQALSARHGAFHSFLFFRREGDRGAAVLELLQVDARVVAALDRAEHDPAPRAVEHRDGGGLVEMNGKRSMSNAAT